MCGAMRRWAAWMASKVGFIVSKSETVLGAGRPPPSPVEAVEAVEAVVEEGACGCPLIALRIARRNREGHFPRCFIVELIVDAHRNGVFARRNIFKRKHVILAG